MNSITREFKAAAEARHEAKRRRYVTSTQFADTNYIERLKDIAKDSVMQEWKDAGKRNLDDIDESVKLDVCMDKYYDPRLHDRIPASIDPD